MYTRARTHTPVLQTDNCFLSPELDAVSCVVLSGVVRPLTAGGVSERCDSAGKVQENKSVSAAAPCETAFHSLPPSSVHLSDFLQKQRLRKH